MKKESFDTPWYLKEASPGNRGEAQEIFLAIGLYLAFKDKKLSKEQIYNFLMQNTKGASVSAGPVSNDKGDTFKLDFPIPISLQAFLSNPQNYSTIKPNPKAIYSGMLTKTVQVIKTEFKDQVNFIHNNKRKDRVNINVVGARGGKIDVQGTVTYMKGKKEITEPLENMQLSLKVGSKHFDALSGKRMVQSFSNVLGVNVQPIAKSTGLEKAIMQIDSQKINDPSEVERLVYGEKQNGPLYKFFKQVATEVSTKLRGKGEEKYERAVIANALGSMIENGVTKREGKLSMLKFKRTGYEILNYTAIRKLTTDMAQADLQVKYDDAKGRPRLFFVDTKGKAYFQIRNFFQQSGGGTIRNYVEALEKFAEYSKFVPYDS